MKIPYLIIVLSLFIVSCDFDSDGEDANTEATEITFSTQLDPSKTDWKLNTTYTDTLEFISFDDDLDYSFVVFRTKNGNTASLVYDELIESRLEHSMFVVEWEIDSLHNAGDDDVMYYDERLLSYSILSQAKYFGDVLVDFSQAYSNDSTDLISNYISPKIGFYTTNNPDLYCLIEQKEQPEVSSFLNSGSIRVLDEKLLGNACNGFPNIENGYYFESIAYHEMPIFESPVDEVMKELTFPLNSDFHGEQFKKVTVILDESQYSILYFILTEGDWFLWAEDKCECGV